jgi:hypothetical protein
MIFFCFIIIFLFEINVACVNIISAVVKGFDLLGIE